MSDDDRDKADNLMLICAGEHTEIDRAGALDILTIEKLQSIKHKHEDWVRRITGLDRNRGTAVLRMIGQIRGDTVDLSKADASAAILQSDDRFPEFPLCHEQYGIEIDLRQLPGEKDGVSYWVAGAAKIDEVIDHKLKSALNTEAVHHLSVFALARLPLVVYLGSKLDDTFEVMTYQRHRETESWVWRDGMAAAQFAVTEPGDEDGDGDEAALILNVSGSVERNELPDNVQHLPMYQLELVNATPGVDTIASRESLQSFDRSIRELFSTIEARNKGCQRLHVFGALPISSCLALGRAHDPHVHPDLVIYERHDGTYREALTIK